VRYLGLYLTTIFFLWFFIAVLLYLNGQEIISFSIAVGTVGAIFALSYLLKIIFDKWQNLGFYAWYIFLISRFIGVIASWFVIGSMEHLDINSIILWQFLFYFISLFFDYFYANKYGIET